MMRSVCFNLFVISRLCKFVHESGGVLHGMAARSTEASARNIRFNSLGLVSTRADEDAVAAAGVALAFASDTEAVFAAGANDAASAATLCSDGKIGAARAAAAAGGASIDTNPSGGNAGTGRAVAALSMTEGASSVFTRGTLPCTLSDALSGVPSDDSSMGTTVSLASRRMATGISD